MYGIAVELIWGGGLRMVRQGTEHPRKYTLSTSGGNAWHTATGAEGAMRWAMRRGYTWHLVEKDSHLVNEDTRGLLSRILD
jgi:hypothetical protein